MQVFKEYRFESAHWLPHVPDGHPCGRMHGHSYRLVIRVDGPLDESSGWVVDFADLDAAFLPLRERLDHHLLNDLEGLENPTCEILARWIWHHLAPQLQGLSELELWETPDAGCRLRATDPNP